MSRRIGHPVAWADLRVGDEIRVIDRDFDVIEDTIKAIHGDTAELEHHLMVHRNARPSLLTPGPNHAAPIAPALEIRGTPTRPEPDREEPTVTKQKKKGGRRTPVTQEEHDRRTRLAIATHELRRNGDMKTADAVAEVHKIFSDAHPWTAKMYQNHQTIGRAPKYKDWLAANPAPSPNVGAAPCAATPPPAAPGHAHRRGPAAAVQKAGEQAALEKERAYAKGVFYAAKRALAETPEGGSYCDTIVQIVHDEDHDWARHGGPPEPGEVMDRLQEILREPKEAVPAPIAVEHAPEEGTDAIDCLLAEAAFVQQRVIERAEKIASDLATHIQALGATLAVARAFLKETDGEDAA